MASAPDNSAVKSDELRKVGMAEDPPEETEPIGSATDSAEAVKTEEIEAYGSREVTKSAKSTETDPTKEDRNRGTTAQDSTEAGQKQEDGKVGTAKAGKGNESSGQDSREAGKSDELADTHSTEVAETEKTSNKDTSDVTRHTGHEAGKSYEIKQGAKAESDTFGRRLDFMEVLSVKCDGFSNVSHVMVVESKVEIKEDVLRKAAFLMSRRHPLLRSRVTGEVDPRKRKEVLFYREIELEENLVDIRVVDDVDWHETQVTDGETQYDTENGPLWRLWLLNSVEITPEESETGHLFRTNIVIGYHHAIMDANAGMKFMDQLLTYLEMVHDESDKADETSLPFLPSFFDQLPPQALRFPWWQKPKLAILALKETFKSSRNLYMKHHQAEIDKNPDVAKRTEIFPLVITSSLTTEILKRSKQNGITVHGAITAAAAVAMVQLIFGENLQSKKELSTMFQANLRRYLTSDAEDDQLGAFFAAAELQIKVRRMTTNEEFWKLAKKCYQGVHRMLGGQVMEITKIFKFLCDDLGVDLVKMLVNEDKALHGRMRAVFSISNMGRCDFVTRENGRPFEITETYMAVAAPRFGPIFVNNVFTFRGKMYISVVYYTHITNKARAKEYAEFFVKALETGCQLNDNN
ncbi:uncharacterized protein [Ptychodera flava]|uniref:uncharacterized protein n=1 Tax=Ptychodera flava TaxID=63121 RepID=UPI00396A0F62